MSFPSFLDLCLSIPSSHTVCIISPASELCLAKSHCQRFSTLLAALKTTPSALSTHDRKCSPVTAPAADQTHSRSLTLRLFFSRIHLYQGIRQPTPARATRGRASDIRLQLLNLHSGAVSEHWRQCALCHLKLDRTAMYRPTSRESAENNHRRPPSSTAITSASDL